MIEEARFQELLGRIYAEVDRTVEDIDTIPEPHAEVSLGRGWRFARQEQGRRALGSFEREGTRGSRTEPRFRGATRRSFDDRSWQTVDIPHTWNAQDTEDTLPGYWRGVGWYRRRFRVASRHRANAVRLRVGAANQRADVWLNGRYVGRHTGGYEGFWFDVTRYVVWGDRENILVLRVDNLYDPDCAPTVKTDIQWYGGLYRDIVLQITGKPYLTRAHLTYQGLETGAAATELDLELSGTAGAVLNVVLTDPSGAVVAERAEVVAGGACRIAGPTVPGPRLWSPETPELYRLSLTVVAAGSATDKIDVPIGFRWYRFDPDGGFVLNGVARKLRGTCWHQVYPGLGNALPRSRHRRDMEVIKQMGVDFLRTSHYPHHDEVLAAADELGIMVLEEMPVNKEIGDPESYTANMLRRIEETVADHFNHPSIILWGLAGEVNAPFDICREVARRCVARFRELDPARKTCMHAPRGDEIAELFDVVGYGLQGSGQTVDEKTHAHRQHARHPRLAIMDTEYSVAQSCRGYFGGGPQSEENACDRHEEYLAKISGVPWLCGGAIWHQFDYNGETYDSVIPRVVSMGMTDVWRLPKDVYYFYQSQWNPRPMVHICGHWTWPGEEGNKRNVKVYTNGRRVDLFLNGRHVATRQPAADGPLEHPPCVFEVPYEPGVLKAVARFDAHPDVVEEAHTAGRPYRLELSGSPLELPYDDRDAHCEITLRVHDRDGHVVPDAWVPVTFYLDGTGELLKQTWPPFGTGTSWYTVAGSTRVLWRPNGFPGTATVKAYTPGLLPGRLSILAVYTGDREVDLLQFREFPHGA